MIKIGIVLPSRGQVFSKTMESVMKNIRGYNYEIFMQHGISIPNCFNFAMEELEKDNDITHVWFVEEDHVFPEDTLKKMLEMDEPVVSTAYADRRSQINLVQYQNNGDVIYTGTGCMLVKREVFSKLQKPYFKSVFIEIQKDQDNYVKIIPHDNMVSHGYGGQDVYFCTSLTAAGYKINMLKNARVGHMQLMETGKDCDNNGKHIIKTVYLPLDIHGNELQDKNLDLCK